MESDKDDRAVSVDSWAESQMSQHALSKGFSFSYNEIPAFKWEQWRIH